MRRTGFSKHIGTSGVTFAMTSGCHSTKSFSEYIRMPNAKLLPQGLYTQKKQFVDDHGQSPIST